MSDGDHERPAARLGRRTFLRLTGAAGTGVSLLGPAMLAAGCRGSVGSHPDGAVIDATMLDASGADADVADAGSDAGNPSRAPNIVLFLVDDLGAADWTPGGSAFYRTPSLERLVREGMHFTHAYSPSPLCSASRASILTGLYPQRVGITGAITCDANCPADDTPRLAANTAIWRKVLTPSYRARLPLDHVTVAEHLRTAGHATAHVGKWHLGGDGYGPERQGFEVAIAGGPYPPAARYFSPYRSTTITDGPPGEYLTDRLTDEAIAFVEANTQRPFFLSLWHFGVHTPFEAPQATIDPYVARRNARDGQRNPAYAAMIEHVDRSLGRLIDSLDALGLSENTMIVVTSDNGGLLLEGSQELARLVTNNAPFRGGKAHVYDGGIRVPFVVRWKGQVAAASTNATPVSGVDLFATFLEAASGSTTGVPSNDGKSLLPLLRGGSFADERDLVWHFPHYILAPRPAGVRDDEQPLWALPASAIRRGSHKLIRVYGEGATPSEDHFELYDLVADPGETTNLASADPSTVTTLAAALDASLADSGAVLPRPNPTYRPAYDRWRPIADCIGVVGDGALTLRPTGPSPQLVASALTLAAPCRVTVRARSASPQDFALWYTTSALPAYSIGRRITASSPGGTGFVDVIFDIAEPAGTVLAKLRLDPLGLSAPLDIDSIRVDALPATSTPIQVWAFSGISGMPYGEAWYAETHASVSHSAVGLHVELGAPTPRIVSDNVTLFGPLRLRMRMRSTGAGDGIFSWSWGPTHTEAANRASTFALVHDGAYHDYAVDLIGAPDVMMRHLALTLGSAAGTADIAWIRAFQFGAAGESLVAAWEFAG